MAEFSMVSMEGRSELHGILIQNYNFKTTLHNISTQWKSPSTMKMNKEDCIKAEADGAPGWLSR